MAAVMSGALIAEKRARKICWPAERAIHFHGVVNHLGIRNSSQQDDGSLLQHQMGSFAD